MVKDIYVKKPEPANPPTATGGAAAPFTLIKAPNKSSKRVHFQDGESLSDMIDKLTETLYRMDMEGKPPKRPYKPYITSPDAEDNTNAPPMVNQPAHDNPVPVRQPCPRPMKKP